MMCRLILASAMTACGFACASPGSLGQEPDAKPRAETPPPPPAWERDAYRVRVSLTAPSAALPPAAAGRVRSDLGESLWRSFGEHWDLSFAPPPAALNRPDAAGLDRLTPADFPPPAAAPTEEEPNPPRPPDRWFVATVAPASVAATGAAWEVAAREWDNTRRMLGPVRTAGASDPAAAAQAAGRLIRDLFHPEYRVSAPEEALPGSTEVLVAARAAALPVRDPAVDPLTDGGPLAVFLRSNDRDGALRDVRETPFTFLKLGPVLDENDPARVRTGEVVSALRTAVGRTRGRTSTLARPIKQDLPATSLRLVARGTADPGDLRAGRALVGYRVLIADRPTLLRDLPPPEEGEERPDPPPTPEPIEEVADRRGRIRVPAAPPTLPGEPATPGLVWLHIYSGKAKLGALPYVAGDVPADVLELDDDALRLGLEGEYALLAGEMTEVVANRAVLTARAKKHAKAGEWDAAEARLVELGALPRADFFRRRIDALAAGVRDEALRSGDRLTASRAAKLAVKMRELADAYLSSDPLAAARSQVGELRELADELAERKRRTEGRRNRRGDR